MLSLTLKGRYTPHSTLSKDSVISSLFNVVIETQGQIYTPIQHYQRREWSLHCSMLSLKLKGRYTPHSTLLEDRVISSLFNVVIETQRQIYPPVNTSRGQSDLFTVQCCHWHSKADILPIQHYQRTEWSLHCSMLSLTLKGRYTPQSTLAEDRVISSLFNVVIDTQRQIYPPFNTIRGQSDLFTVQCCHWDSKADIPPIQHYQRTEWSLHCSMLSLTLKGRYTPLFNIIRGQSDLFTVQCCHWHSKVDIPPYLSSSKSV